MSKFLAAFLISIVALPAFSQTMKFSFKDDDLTNIIATYSKATKQTFVVDPGVRGKGTILSADNVSQEEAFNLLSSALAMQSYAIIKQGDTMLVKSARQVQRDLIETTATLPALKPERMVTYVRTLKNVSASTLNNELRIIPSRDGEMSVFSPSNQLIISDWTSNLHRIDTLLATLDVPPSATAQKFEAERKAQRARATPATAPVKTGN